MPRILTASLGCGASSSLTSQHPIPVPGFILTSGGVCARAGWLKLEQKEGVTEKKMPPKSVSGRVVFLSPGALTVRLGLCLLLGLFSNR